MQADILPESTLAGHLPAARPISEGARILCVDDDANVIEGYRRALGRKFRIHTATGGLQGLEAIAAKGPFSVVVADLRMPVMDGIQFLAKVRAISPDTVRIMLTGQGDLATAMAAVNQGNIFRFLSKPCTPVVLEKVLEAGIEQHRLVTAERELTRETLLGCVQVLVEVLSIVQPEAFSRSTRVRRYVRQIAAGIGLECGWELEAAAMLSQIGWITLPPGLLQKAGANWQLSEEEMPLFLAHAKSAAGILGKIPRLDTVAGLIARQHTAAGEDIAGLVLRAAIEFDNLRQGGLSQEDILRAMTSRTNGRNGVYTAATIAAVAGIGRDEASDEVRIMSVAELAAGMILEDDLRNENGVLLFGRGQEVSATFTQRMANFDYGLPPERMCRVRLRAGS